MKKEELITKYLMEIESAKYKLVFNKPLVLNIIKSNIKNKLTNEVTYNCELPFLNLYFIKNSLERLMDEIKYQLISLIDIYVYTDSKLSFCAEKVKNNFLSLVKEIETK